MAGDWIPVSVELPAKPEVARLATALRRSPDEVVGLLLRFWIWAQAHTGDGRIHLRLAEVARVVAVPEAFLRALVKVGWLRAENGSVRLARWERWFSQGAKRRLQAARRQRRRRR